MFSFINFKKSHNEKLAPIHLAIWKGFLPLASALLQAGSNPNLVDALQKLIFIKFIIKSKFYGNSYNFF